MKSVTARNPKLVHGVDRLIENEERIKRKIVGAGLRGRPMWEEFNTQTKTQLAFGRPPLGTGGRPLRIIRDR
jgi:hypothetical protein